MPYGRAVPAPLSPPRAVIFDFNGTISDDEPLLARIFAREFAEVGIDVDEALYYREFAGYSDPEIVERVLRWFDRWDPAVFERLIGRRTEYYLEAVAERSPVRPAAADFVRRVAERVPAAVCSGSSRVEILAVLRSSGLDGLFQTVVSAEDVERGKPDPEGYRIALGRLRDAMGELAASDALVFEDTWLGMQAARAAGARVVAVEGTATPEQLAEADAVVSALDWSIPLVEGWNA
jgi:beta-phosphoglucomutase